jgi:uncharacterized repeat protein (TIGR03803 family)
MHRVAVTIAACCSLVLAGCSQGQIPSPPLTSSQAAVTPKITRYRVLLSFNGRFGTHPTGSLAQFNKLLFGTATSGSANGQGALFRVNPDGKDDRLLHSFKGGEGGCTPTGGGVFASRGSSFYGTTTACGNATKGGLVFSEYAGGNQFRVWHVFDLASDGGNPEGGLLPIGSTLYGTTPNGGAHGQGTVYSLDTKTDAFSVLHTFGAVKDAAGPVAALTELDGKLFGTSRDGGSDGVGAVYEFDPRSGTEKVLHSFDGTDGARPTAALLTWGGMLYGVTPRGGVSSAGILFKIDPTNGDETVLYNFGHGDAIAPDGSLVVHKDALYGTTRRGGANGKDFGTVFRYTPATKSFDELYAFAGKPDGAHPRGGLLYLNVDRQEQLFGTTYDGGNDDLGTVFSVVP